MKARKGKECCLHKRVTHVYLKNKFTVSLCNDTGVHTPHSSAFSGNGMKPCFMAVFNTSITVNIYIFK